MLPAFTAEFETAVRLRYDEPHRNYHDRRHLDAVLTAIDLLVDHAANPDAVRLAALFHDAIYVIGRDDNETASAALARDLLSDALATADHPSSENAQYDGSLVDEVVRLVLLTATHAPEADDANGAVLCDADLRVLAGSPADYAQYVADVRAEWSHLDDRTFARGRADVLEALLKRPTLFTTSTARDRWEAAGRHNVGIELALLRTQL